MTVANVLSSSVMQLVLPNPDPRMIKILQG